MYLFVATFLHANGLAESLVFTPYLAFLIYLFVSELYNKQQMVAEEEGGASC